MDNHTKTLSQFSERVSCRQQVALAELSRAAVSVADRQGLSQLFQSAVEQISAALDVEFCTVLKQSADRSQLQIVAGTGWKPEWQQASLELRDLAETAGDGSSLFDLHTVEPDIVQHHQYCPSARDAPEIFREHGIVAGLMAVIGMSGDEVWGVFAVHSAQSREYSPEEIECVGQVAGILSHAAKHLRCVERNASLEAELRQRTDLLEMLHDVALYAHEARSLDGALEVILSRVAKFNGWCFGHAYRMQPGGPERLVPLKAVYSESSDLAEAFRRATCSTTFEAGEGLPGQALQTGQAVWVDEFRNHFKEHRRDLLARLPIESAAAFPVVVDNEIVLVLEFFSAHRIEIDQRVRQAICDVPLHLARTIERLRAETALRESEERFRELAESINQVFWVLEPKSWEVLYVSPSWSELVGISDSTWYGNADAWLQYVHEDDREWVVDEFQENATQREFEAVYRIVRPDGTIRWVHEASVPIRNEAGVVQRVIGVIDDVTERRELERQVADATTHEQQRLSRDLHDSIGQELTGVTMLAQRHARSLRTSEHPEAETAETLLDQLKKTVQQVRRISRGLAPVDVEAGGLVVALAQLVDQTRLASATDCTFHCDEAVTVNEAGIATHLFRIAQEAVSNAIRHAEATLVTVTLERDGEFCCLSISDDGGGFSGDRISVSGLGLRTMKYRANLIGAQLRIQSKSGAGTKIVCRFRC